MSSWLSAWASEALVANNGDIAVPCIVYRGIDLTLSSTGLSSYFVLLTLTLSKIKRQAIQHWTGPTIRHGEAAAQVADLDGCRVVKVGVIFCPSSDMAEDAVLLLTL